MTHNGTRNLLPVPRIQHEEEWSRPLEIHAMKTDWTLHVNTHDRLYNHHTLSSIRKHYRLKGPFVPKDDLDFRIVSACEPDKELFPDSSDVCRQHETLGRETWRLLKNIRIDLTKNQKDFIYNLQKYGREIKPILKPKLNYNDDAENSLEYDLNRRLIQAGQVLRKNGFGHHGVVYGGYSKKVNLCNLKLGIPSSHSPQSNNAYGRKFDGSFFSTT